MAVPFTDLSQDVLILVCLNLQVEDVLALMQTCRVMHALGSLDYLWHTLLSHWDIPLDIPLNISITSLSSDFLRLAAVRSLKLDTRWRNPRLEMRHARRIISQSSSFVDGMCFLPGGLWLVTLQYERTSRTHITLWSIADSNDHAPIFKVTIVGRVRFLHAHHHRESERIKIGIASADGSFESIRAYDIFLRNDTSPHHSLVFEATPDELHPMGRIAGMKMNGEVMIAVFTPLSSSLEPDQVICVNLASRAAAILECPEWSFAWGRLKIFRRHFAVTTSGYTSQHTATYVSFYELPSAILDHSDCPSSSVPCWPERVTIKSPLIANTWWSSDDSLVLELSDDAPTSKTGACSFTIFGYPVATRRTDQQSLRINIIHVSLDGRDVERTVSVVASRSIPSAGEIRISSSGRRAVWLHLDPDTHECTLMKFALGRTGGESRSCVSTLMPSFSGLPFNPRDFHSFVFDEISCRMAVGLPTGELYILHY